LSNILIDEKRRSTGQTSPTSRCRSTSNERWKSWRWQDVDRPTLFSCQSHACGRKNYHRTLKLARTIADLIGVERIETAHLAEAIQYRPRWQV
jgi:predicted ATPase with chaperone activity